MQLRRRWPAPRVSGATAGTVCTPLAPNLRMTSHTCTYAFVHSRGLEQRSYLACSCVACMAIGYLVRSYTWKGLLDTPMRMRSVSVPGWIKGYDSPALIFARRALFASAPRSPRRLPTIIKKTTHTPGSGPQTEPRTRAGIEQSQVHSSGGHGRGHRLELQNRAAARHVPLTVKHRHFPPTIHHGFCVFLLVFFY